MILVRGDKFIKEGSKLYIVGSSSNKYYRLAAQTMGKFKLMGWLIDKGHYDLSHLEVFDEHNNVELILNDNKASFWQKLKIIQNQVKQADCVCVKMSLTNSIIACFFAILYRKPYMMESAVDCYASLRYHDGFLYKLAALPVDLIVKLEHRLAKHIIYVSKFYLQHKYPSKARQIGCSDAILDCPSDDVLYKRLKKIDTNEGIFVLGLIGSTDASYRGHDVLIKVSSRLIKKGYDVRVRFLGGGTKQSKLLELAEALGVKDKIEFCGRLQHNEVLSWIDEIDILVMPTLAESLGRAVIEAMSRACPVIGSVETALREQIGSDCLAYARDIEQITFAIENIITRKEYAKTCAYENFYRAQKYSSDYTYSLRREFYNEFYKIENIKRG